MLRTQWDPFEELRGAEDELNPMIHQMSSLLPRRSASGRYPLRAAPRPGRRRSTSPSARTPTW